jgi:hypothetical protein
VPADPGVADRGFDAYDGPMPSPSPTPTIAPVEIIEDQTVPITNDGDHERMSHVIRKSDEMKGYVMGEEVTALCGKKWVPSRDPQRYPVCPTCLEMLAALRGG